MNIITIQDDVGITFQSIDQKSIDLKYYVKMLLNPSIVGEEIEPMEVTFDLLIDLNGHNTNYEVLTFGNGTQVLLFLDNLFYLPHLCVTFNEYLKIL
jgi:hypothetical protein